jgi:propionaldehyde dehydrogenase
MLLYEHYANKIVDQAVPRTQVSAASIPAMEKPRDSSWQRSSAVPSPATSVAGGQASGVFDSVDRAVEAALEASRKLARFPLSKRGFIIGQMRKIILDNLEFIARLAYEETKMGRVEDKISKNRLVAEKTPGIEALTTTAFSGDAGLALEEFAPFGVIGAIIPSTNPTETVINNGISMFAAGNAVVFNPHPNATVCSLVMMSMLNQVIIENGGPENCFVGIANPTIETAEAIMHHPKIPFLAVTGAEGVVRAAMKSGKRVAAAGPGNPPAVVDETADIQKAARDIVLGGSLDNGIICIAEKVTVVVDRVAEELVLAMEKQGCYRASANQIRLLEGELFAQEPQPEQHTPVKRDYVGRDARLILESIGTRVDTDPRLILCEVPPEHPMAWTEMLMPVMPIVRMPNVDAAIDYAVRVERGNRHTATMHSRNIDKLMEMGRRMDCSIFIKNGPSFAGLGLEGEGPTSFTIASPTGDGLTNARTFCRIRRCTLSGNYNFL